MNIANGMKYDRVPQLQVPLLIRALGRYKHEYVPKMEAFKRRVNQLGPSLYRWHVYEVCSAASHGCEKYSTPVKEIPRIVRRRRSVFALIMSK